MVSPLPALSPRAPLPTRGSPPPRSKAAHRVAVLAAEALGLEVGPDSPRLFCSLIPPNEKKVAALR